MTREGGEGAGLPLRLTSQRPFTPVPFQQRILHHQLPGPPCQGHPRAIWDRGRVDGELERGAEAGGWQGNSTSSQDLVCGVNRERGFREEEPSAEVS